MGRKRTAASATGEGGETAQAAPAPKRGAARGAAAKAEAAAAAAAEQQQPDEAPPKAAAAPKRGGGGRGAKKASAAAADAAAEPEAPPAKAPRGGGGSMAKAKVAPVSSSKPKPDYYLMKSEPHVFSIDDLEGRPGQTEPWDGVRNAVARNMMDSMRVGDSAFFYHSSCKVPGIVGVVKIVKESYPDPSQFDKASDYYDPKASRDAPKWRMVDIKLERRLSRPISLEELKSHKGGALAGMALFRQSRLSVQPVSKAEWEFITGLEGEEGEEAAPSAKPAPKQAKRG